MDKITTKTGRPISVVRTDQGYPLTCSVCNQIRYVKHNRGRKNRKGNTCLSCAMKAKANPSFFVLPSSDVDSYIEGESAAKIAQRLGTSAGVVISALKRQGVYARSMSQAIKLIGNENLLRSAEELRRSGQMGILISAGQQNIPVEEWQEYRRDYWSRVRSSIEWKTWRTAVFERDGYRCAMCEVGSERASGNLHPHHIYPKAKYPEKVFDVENGITLCGKCHEKTYGKEEEFIDLFSRKVIAVPPHHTSQRCHQCGHTCRENRISQASFVCVACGHSENADINASRNILHRAGHALHGANDSEVMHVVA